MLELGRMPWNPVPSLGEPVPAACDAALTWAECSGTRFPVWGNRFLLCVFGSELGQSALEPGSQFGGTGSCCVFLVLNLGRVPWNPVPSLGEPVPAACDAALTWAECSGTRFPVWGNRFLLCVFGSELGQSALEPGSQ